MTNYQERKQMSAPKAKLLVKIEAPGLKTAGTSLKRIFTTHPCMIAPWLQFTLIQFMDDDQTLPHILLKV